MLPVLKEGKISTDKCSYRPIALTSCLGKVMEHLAVRRMHLYLEKNNLLDSSQSGYRMARSAIDLLVRLESDIRKTFLRDEYLIAVFLDIQKAFDSVWHYGLLEKVRDIGIEGRLGNYIRNFLKDRHICVALNGIFSQEYKVDGGVPQGSVISPLLFSIMVTDLFKHVERGIKYSIYADNTALWYRCNCLEEGERVVQNALCGLEEWSRNWGLSFAPSKTKMLIFTNKRKRYTPELYLENCKIDLTAEKRFLGMILDSRLTWRAHVISLVERCQSALNIMKYVAYGKLGADRKVLLQMYHSLIRSKIDYGSFLYETAARSNLEKVDRIQYQALRLALGALKCTPVHVLEAEANTMPLIYRRQMLGIKYIAKCLTIENHIIAREYKDFYHFHFYDM